MNKNTHRLVFNKSRGCVVAVAETASSCSKCASGTSSPPKRHCKSSNCLKTAKSAELTLSKVPPAQWIRAQAAPKLVVGNAITYAKQFNLRPGIALSAAQMAQLTSDIVWLVEQTVTLPDGSTTRALVPQLYVTNIRPGDMDGTGALLSAQAININVTGDVNNSGTIGSNITGNMGNRTLVSINAVNINNLHGNIQASTVGLTATRDITNTGGNITAGSQLVINAGRDIDLTSTTASNKNAGGAFTRTMVDRLAGVYVVGLDNTPGSLVLNAGRNINAQAAVIANTSANGETAVIAGRDINLTTVTTDQSLSTGGGANYFRGNSSQDAGTSITSNGNLTLSAGNNINALAANLQSSQGTTNLLAAGSINLLEGRRTSDMAWGSETKTSGFLSSSTTTRRETGSTSQAVGTDVGGVNVNLLASKDITVKGSSVIADKDATLSAGGNITIEAATNTQSQTSFTQKKESGILSGGGFGITIGKREQSTEQKSQNTTAAASTVGAINGNINISAGQTFKQVGSDVIAPGLGNPAGGGDINITAKKVDILEARETSQTTTEQKFKQTGITVSVGSPVIAAISQAEAMRSAASQTSSGRMQALAGASTALNVYNNAKDIGQAMADPVGSARINLSLGTSQSQSNTSSTSDTARGSTATAGNNININATGGGAESNLLIQGSQVKAGNSIRLEADNQINLLAAKNESSQTSKNSSSSSSVSASYGAGGWGGGASASKGQGKSDGQDISYSNTNITAGNTTTIKSGGDTNVIGATVAANQIKADIGANLNIQSLQDKSTYSGSQQNVSGSFNVGGGGNSASVSASKSNINSNFQSVGQQSGLKAGDGGFQVSVNNNTALTGAVIASTQTAVDNNKNSFTTGNQLTITDIQNQASFKGNAVGVSAGFGNGKPSGSAGVGSTGGNAASVSSAGISGIAGNTSVRTGDAETGFQKIFDTQKVQREINAQVAITQAFSKEAPKAVATFSADQMADLKKDLAKETDPDKKTAITAEIAKWDEGGRYRVLLHTLAGAFSGGASGAAGAVVSASAAPLMNQLQDGITDALKNAGLGDTAAKGIASGIAGLTAAGVGAAVGGTQGAATAFTVDTNNRQLHREEKTALAKTAGDFAKKMRLQGYALTDERALAILTEQADNRIDETQARRLDTATMDDTLKSHAQRYLNGVGNTLGSYDDGRGNQIRYFSNTTASGDRRFEDYKNSAINAMPHTPPIDYVSIQGGGFGVGGGVSVNVLNQETFVGGGKATFSSIPGFSIVGGRMIDGPTTQLERSDAVSKMLDGGSIQGAICAGGICAGLNQSIGPVGSNPPKALELGIGTPGVSGGVGAAAQLPAIRGKK